jgi:predicted phosphoribosyltransferase
MWLFDTFLGLVALMVAGLIGATITFLLMQLGLPKQTEECITFHDEDHDAQIKEVAEEILKNAKEVDPQEVIESMKTECDDWNRQLWKKN